MDIDRPTKTRTARGRLAWLDRLLCQSGAVSLEGALLVDVGFGDEPFTTLEWAAHVAAAGARVIGIEQNPAHVARAQSHLMAATPTLCLRTGGFDLVESLGENRCARVIRVANVLRAYPEHDVKQAWLMMARSLEENGLLIDATCDREGHVGTALWLRRCQQRLVPERLFFSTDGTRGFAPLLFRDTLPRVYRRRAKPGTPIDAFFRQWMDAWRIAHAASPEGAFRSAVEPIPDLSAVDGGIACWRPKPGFPPMFDEMCIEGWSIPDAQILGEGLTP
jgi:hypothetical protein